MFNTADVTFFKEKSFITPISNRLYPPQLKDICKDDILQILSIDRFSLQKMSKLDKLKLTSNILK